MFARQNGEHKKMSSTAICCDTKLRNNIRIKIDEEISADELSRKLNLKDLIQISFEKLGFYFRSNHNILSKRNKLNKIANTIHHGLPLVKRQVAESKHVMFIDQCCGMELELIHTIQVNLEDSLKNKWVSQIKNYSSTPYGSSSELNKINETLTPMFELNRKETHLIKNGICLNSVEIYDHVSFSLYI